jgi:4,5-dihydroxyphthalate decarboxylase
MRIQLSLACVPNHDRTGPLLTGEIQPDGIEFIPTSVAHPGELFRRVAQFGEFDVSEMSTSTFTAMVSRGDDRYIGIPVFPSRAFRHAYIWVNVDAGIQRPEDLKGKRVAVTEYQQTAGVWIRGMLHDDHGVAPTDITWVTGGLEGPEPERYPIEVRRGIRIEDIREDQSLDRMLESGEVDAMLGARVPTCFTRRSPKVRRLFTDYYAAERDYYRRTRFFPMMHTVVLRRSIFEQHPWVARNVMLAFEQAKRRAFERLWDFRSAACAIPWLMAIMEQSKETMGEDMWPYGLEKNEHAIRYVLKQSFLQGLSPKELTPADLYPAAVS